MRIRGLLRTVRVESLGAPSAEGRVYWSLPIAEKESCRRLEVAEQARKTLSQVAMMTIIAGGRERYL